MVRIRILISPGMYRVPRCYPESMPDWNPAQYLRYSDLRTRPSYDLAQRVQVPKARRIADLGCGPGNSAAVCADRWPGASVLGIDSSPAMIEKARAAWPGREWKVADIAAWAFEEHHERFDVVFSSAALHCFLVLVWLFLR